MAEQACWTIIERARRESTEPGEIVEEVLELLRKSSPQEIEAFDRGLAQLMSRSYTWALWGAAYLINGGCSDDGFDYFRGWLLTQGREVFEAALADPDSLAGIVKGEDLECSDILYVAMHAYEEVAGEDFEGATVYHSDLGEGWDFDDAEQMQRRYPRLWVKFAYASGYEDDEDDED
jgi:hypothetical protein